MQKVSNSQLSPVGRRWAIRYCHSDESQNLLLADIKTDPDFHQDDELCPLHITYYGLLIFNFNPPAGELIFDF